jgi:hypothetical protein
LLALAISTTVVAVAYGLWLADHFPQRQAKLIVAAPKDAERLRAESQLDAGKEITPKDAPDESGNTKVRTTAL